MMQQLILADGEPDPISFAPPIEQQEDWLAAVAHDDDQYVEIWLACLRQISCHPFIQYTDTGKHLAIGSPLEDSHTDRQRMAYRSRLVEHMNCRGKRGAVMAEVERRRAIMDLRPADLKAAMSAIRQLLGMGFRFLLHPDRRVEICGGPRNILADDQTYLACREAMRAYRSVEYRSGSAPLIRRAIRLLGREHAPSKIIVLEASK